MMIERLLIAAGAALLLGLARFAFGTYAGFRFRTTARTFDPRLWADLGIAAGPAVVYFWTETCGQCRTMQTPALNRLTETMAAVRMVSVNAVQQPALADRFGVMTVPTTVVIDEAGHLRAINHGYADERTLRAQLAQED
jgi:thioredoxin 1